MIPKFENPKELNFSAKFNFSAFFFSVIYYAIKGMWKKALAILGLNIILKYLKGKTKKVDLGQGMSNRQLNSMLKELYNDKPLS